MDYAKSPPPGLSGILVTADRDDDDAGVTARIKFSIGAAKSVNDTWNTNQSARLGSQTNLSMFGGIAMGSNAGRRDYSELLRAVDQAVMAPPEMPFEIVTSVRSD